MSDGWTYGQPADSRAVRGMIDELLSEGRGAITRGTRERAKALSAALAPPVPPAHPADEALLAEVMADDRKTVRRVLGRRVVEEPVPFTETRCGWKGCTRRAGHSGLHYRDTRYDRPVR